MNVQDVRKLVEEIRSIAGDDEVAHSREDDLYHSLLHAIANGTCSSPEACAKEALKTERISFARWCA